MQGGLEVDADPGEAGVRNAVGGDPDEVRIRRAGGKVEPDREVKEEKVEPDREGNTK